MSQNISQNFTPQKLISINNSQNNQNNRNIIIIDKENYLNADSDYPF